MTPTQPAAAPVATVLDAGALTPFFEAGVLSPPDLQVAATLLRLTVGRSASGTPFQDRDISLAIALTVRALRDGSVCLTLSDDPSRWVPDEEEPQLDSDASDVVAELPWPEPERWHGAVAAHPAVAAGEGGPADRPLRLVADRLYLQRYWADEQLIAAEVKQRSRTQDVDAPRLHAALARLFPDSGHDAQRLATAMAVTRSSSIITGGPGTGKTTTVARLLAVLRELDPGVTIGLAAPTGKAAARLQEAVAEALDALGGGDLARVGHPPAVTLHRLLGWVPRSSSRFAHHRGNPLPHDVVIVDESSMVALPMMARLLEAVRPDARVVLVGDADQLASVEAGAVLGDLVAAAPDWATPDDEQRAEAVLTVACPIEAPGSVAGRGVVRLERVRRFGGRIAELSQAIRWGDPEAVLGLLATRDDEVVFEDVTDPGARAAAREAVRAQVVAQALDLRAAGIAGEARAAVHALDSHRVLCAHRRGPDGVMAWNVLIDAWTRPPAAEWYPGRPILVNRNDPGAGVSNGDTGVTVDDPQTGLRVAFPRGAEPLLLPPGRLEEVETLRSLTIHRAQGSQFATVTVVLPERRSPLLTRELLYTAVTRAQRRVRILGTPAAIEAAVTTPVRRASGLRQSVRGPENEPA
jgi:exodeoxyribonuclease V alpha subunit